MSYKFNGRSNRFDFLTLKEAKELEVLITKITNQSRLSKYDVLDRNVLIDILGHPAIAAYQDSTKDDVYYLIPGKNLFALNMQFVVAALKSLVKVWQNRAASLQGKLNSI